MKVRHEKRVDMRPGESLGITLGAARHSLRRVVLLYIYFMAGCDNIFVEDKVLNIFGSFVRFSDSKAFVCLLVFCLLFWMNGTICWKGSLSIQEFNPTKYTMAFLPALLR